MICELRGMEYGLSHSCGGPRSTEAQQFASAALTPPDGAGPAYYLEQAWKIARWDDAAIRRNSKDSRATIFGWLFWLASVLVILIVQSYPVMRLQPANAPPATSAMGMVFGLAFGAILMAAITLVQLGLCHRIAKLIFGANGRFVRLVCP